jgi:glucan phosphoethanolaminetransferase (alkaline phosphatase superfamily)
MPVVHDNDREAARIIQESLKAKNPQFIYLNKRGVHFHYEYFYPQGSGKFYPCLIAGEVTRDRNKLINSYKNAVQWAVDSFFQALLANATDLGSSVIMYTSDHGQNLLEDGDPVTHCREKPTRQEAMVPLLVLTGNHPLFEKFKGAAVKNRNRANHFQIFPTILELFGFSPAEIKEKYYVTLFDSMPERLGFTSGAIFGRFGKTPKWTPLPEDITQCCDKQ